jgi:hypothetical protein
MEWKEVQKEKKTRNNAIANNVQNLLEMKTQSSF